MEHTALIQNGRSLKAKFYFSRQSLGHVIYLQSGCQILFSNKYVVGGLVSMQLRADLIKIEAKDYYSATIFVKFLLWTEFDDANIALTFNSKTLNVENMSLLVNDGFWKEVGSSGFTPKTDTKNWFDVSVELNIKENFPAAFENLHDDKELVDLELRGVDGSVLVHKAVLAGCSTVFRQELSAQYVQVQHATQLTLQQLKDFIYLRVLPDDMEKVVEIASFYKISGLELQCFIKLMNNFTLEYANEIMKLAMRNKMKRLLIAASRTCVIMKFENKINL